MKYTIIALSLVLVFVAGQAVTKHVVNKGANEASVLLAQGGFVPPTVDRPPLPSGSGGFGFIEPSLPRPPSTKAEPSSEPAQANTCPACTQTEQKIKQKQEELNQIFASYAKYKLGLGTRPTLSDDEIIKKVKALESEISTLRKQLGACTKACRTEEVRRALPAGPQTSTQSTQ